MQRVFVKLEFQPRDLWVGVFWRVSDLDHKTWDVWICIVPMLPLHIGWWTRAHD